MKKVRLSIFSIVLVALMGLSSALAFPGYFGQYEGGELPGDHEAIQDAVTTGDFEAWRELMAAQLTEERFNKLVEVQQNMAGVKEIHSEIREAREAGDDARVEELLDEFKENMPAHAQKSKRYGHFWSNLKGKFWRH